MFIAFNSFTIVMAKRCHFNKLQRFLGQKRLKPADNTANDY